MGGRLIDAVFGWFRRHPAPRPPSELLAAVVVWTVTLAVAVTLGSAILGGVLRFRPYTLHVYTLLPAEVCPSDELRLFFDADAKRPVLGSITRFRNASRWVEEATGERLETEFDSVAFNGRYGPRAGVSEFVRYAPKSPGLWHIETSIFVEGFQLVRPETQQIGDLELAPIVTEPVRVREPDEPECSGS